MFSVAECESMVRIANEVSAWTTDRHEYFPTDDVQIDLVPELSNISAAIDVLAMPPLALPCPLAPIARCIHCVAAMPLEMQPVSLLASGASCPRSNWMCHQFSYA